MYVCIVGMHVYLLIVIYRCPPSIPCCLFMFTSWVLKCPSRLSELRAWVSLACPWHLRKTSLWCQHLPGYLIHTVHGCALKNASRRRNIPVAPKISTCTAKGAIAVQTRLPLWSMLRVPNKCLIERKASPTFPFMSSKNAGSVSGRLYKQRLGWGIL